MTVISNADVPVLRRRRPDDDFSQIEVLTAQQLIGYVLLTSAALLQWTALDLTLVLVSNELERKDAFDT